MTEGTVDFLVNRRLNKSQRLRWSRPGVDLFLQVRCAVYNGVLDPEFGQLSKPVGPPVSGISPGRLIAIISGHSPSARAPWPRQSAYEAWPCRSGPVSHACEEHYARRNTAMRRLSHPCKPCRLPGKKGFLSMVTKRTLLAGVTRLWCNLNDSVAKLDLYS
jgi:hypothetical protein